MKCFDPRDGQVKETDNVALAMLEWLRGMPNGGGVEEARYRDADLDFDSFARGADTFEPETKP